ncbi:MAG: DsrE family protein [Planctomycetota bacterium]
MIAVVLAIVALGAVALFGPARAQPDDARGRVAVVWTSGDPEVAHRMCLMYTHAARTAGWFDRVRLVVWGPSARLLAADKDLQTKVKAMMKDGVELQACVVCADSYGVSDDLRAMGIEVKGMGKPLSDMLRGDWHVLTF